MHQSDAWEMINVNEKYRPFNEPPAISPFQQFLSIFHRDLVGAIDVGFFHILPDGEEKKKKKKKGGRRVHQRY